MSNKDDRFINDDVNFQMDLLYLFVLSIINYFDMVCVKYDFSVYIITKLFF